MKERGSGAPGHSSSHLCLVISLLVPTASPNAKEAFLSWSVLLARYRLFSPPSQPCEAGIILS